MTNELGPLSAERVAVTGVGMVSALGFGAAVGFERLILGQSGIGRLQLFDASEQRSELAAEVKDLNIASIAPEGESELWSRADAMAWLAAREACEAAGVDPPASSARLGIAVGATTGGMFETEQVIVAARNKGFAPEQARRLLDYPLSITAERLSRRLARVECTATVCSACSSSATAMVQGMSWLRRGRVERVLAGGVDALCRLTFVGFNALAATDPEACRPFDVARKGLCLGEGAAFLVLELESHARERGAKILAWLSGASVLAEAHHITHPEPTGTRAAELMRGALADAGLEPDDVDYVNAHGTGTVQNDAMEAKALQQLFKDPSTVLVSSSKAQVGHTLGAAGAIEAVITVLSLEHGLAPATLGLTRPEVPELGHVIGQARPAKLRVALSNSFGFGGMGTVLVFEHETSEARPRPQSPRSRVVVSAFAALESPIDPLAALDPERSRRFDRATAFVAHGASVVLKNAGRSGQGVGLVVGLAYGSVDRSIRFVLRAIERGPRFANPAEFPHLVASGSAGNASVYAGLDGPVLSVSERAESAESALARGLSLLDFGATTSLIVGGASAQDPIVDAVLGSGHSDRESGTRGEGAGWILLELADRAQPRAPRLAEVAGHEELWIGSKHATLDAVAGRWFNAGIPRSALLVTASLDEVWLAELAASKLAVLELRSLGKTRAHEALGALAWCEAIAELQNESREHVLVLSGAERRGYLTHFRQVRSASDSGLAGPA